MSCKNFFVTSFFSMPFTSVFNIVITVKVFDQSRHLESCILLSNKIRMFCSIKVLTTKKSNKM